MQDKDRLDSHPAESLGPEPLILNDVPWTVHERVISDGKTWKSPDGQETWEEQDATYLSAYLDDTGHMVVIEADVTT